MPRVSVLGAGLVGSLIARTLAADGWDVLVCDRSEDALGALAGLPRVATARLDFASGAAIAAAVVPSDVVVGAVPEFLEHAMPRRKDTEGSDRSAWRRGRASASSGCCRRS